MCYKIKDNAIRGTRSRQVIDKKSDSLRNFSLENEGCEHTQTAMHRSER
jgi:hypothetical protein